MSRLRHLSVLAAVILCTFLTALDNSVVNIALPRIRTELGLGETDLKWVATAYPLTLASFLLLGGHLTDAKGRRWTLTTGLAVFTAASVCCALSADGVMLVCSRGLQGLGAAFTLPASLAILSHDLPQRARTTGFGATAATLAFALAFGPVISGVVTQHLGWEWLFLLNVPLGLSSLVVGSAAVPRSSSLVSPGSRKALAAVPLRVVALACVSLAALVYFLIEGPTFGVTAPRVVVSGVISATAAAGVCFAVTHRPIPALRTLFGQRAFTGGLITQLLWGLGVSGVYFYTSQFLQTGLRLSPTSAGLTFVPVASALLLTVPFVTVLTRRWGDGGVSAAGLLLVALGLLLVALGSLRGGLADLLPGLVAVGAGSALALPLTTRALESPPGRLSGFAAGLFSGTRELSGVFGIAFVGAIVTLVQRASVSGGVPQVEAFVSGYQAGLCIAAALAGAGAPVAVWALRPRVCGREGCCRTRACSAGRRD
ncbi:MFS transporter [Streptomyces sp. S.PNR 29]|uniref:MFS transporter n=1 Tax=Streptomyces sp. S.PNR 29 TaxID=2973805 RepID=UPI0025B02C54|nr:MFS transporter [Streptomyces sp. S.PNR 29]MDN0196801.1 MFS transporter [Streptomyces sp. S.PNR 29]